MTVSDIPTASFSATPTGSTVSVDASASSDDGSIVSYAWDFGDGATGTGVTTDHMYTTGGEKTITLVVTDNMGQTDTATETVTVVMPNVKPTAAFTSSVAGLTVSVDGSDSSDPDGDALTYSWDFGDGSAAGSGKTADHAFAAAGTYQVTLTVSDGELTATANESVTVSDIPTASFTATPTGSTVSVDASASSDDGSIVSYAWDFGDGATGTGVTTDHGYTTGGEKTITLMVTDNMGQTDTATETVTVVMPNVKPTAAFTSSVAGLTVSVDGSDSSDPDGDTLTYSWDFGDGSAAGSGKTADHTFAAAGTYPGDADRLRR